MKCLYHHCRQQNNMQHNRINNSCLDRAAFKNTGLTGTAWLKIASLRKKRLNALFLIFLKQHSIKQHLWTICKVDCNIIVVFWNPYQCIADHSNCIMLKYKAKTVPHVINMHWTRNSLVSNCKNNTIFDFWTTFSNPMVKGCLLLYSCFRLVVLTIETRMSM